MKMTVNPAVTETKVVEISPATYTLELNEQEGALLAGLVGKVGGFGGKYSSVVSKLWNDGLLQFRDSKYYPRQIELINDNTIKFIGD